MELLLLAQFENAIRARNDRNGHRAKFCPNSKSASGKNEVTFSDCRQALNMTIVQHTTMSTPPTASQAKKTSRDSKSKKSIAGAAPVSAQESGKPLTKNKHLITWVEKMAALTQPAAIHWVEGSQSEYEALCKQLIAGGTFTKLNQKLWPGCYYAKSDPSDVARVEDRTFICSLSKDNAGPTNNWMDPFEMRRKLKGLFNGCMRGRTMYVLPYSMGPIGSPMSQIGVQLTDSAYAVVNMRIMARIGLPVFNEIDSSSKRGREELGSGLHGLLHDQPGEDLLLPGVRLHDRVLLLPQRNLGDVENLDLGVEALRQEQGSCKTVSEASRTLPNRSSFWLRISNVNRCASLSRAMKLTTVTSRCWLYRWQRPMRCSMRCGFHGRS